MSLLNFHLWKKALKVRAGNFLMLSGLNTKTLIDIGEECGTDPYLPLARKAFCAR